VLREVRIPGGLIFRSSYVIIRGFVNCQVEITVKRFRKKVIVNAITNTADQITLSGPYHLNAKYRRMCACQICDIVLTSSYHVRHIECSSLDAIACSSLDAIACSSLCMFSCSLLVGRQTNPTKDDHTNRALFSFGNII
jgi:hypothetical protein